MTELHSNDTDIQDSTTDLLHILIAESNPVGLLVNNAKALGWRVSSVTSGFELVNEIMAWAGSGCNLPDVLMVDWQMPNVDWLEALSILTENIKHQKLPTILVVSDHGSEHIAKVDIEYLANKILYKPISGSALFNAVNDAVVKHSGNCERVFKSTRIEALKVQWLPRVNVLVVDDSEINLEVIEQILIKNGAIVTTLKCGQAALQQLYLTPNAFDIILMDVQMPEMDGIETTQYIRQQLSLDRLPIVALTAGTLVQEKRRAFDSGVNDFLTKPIKPFLLISTVRKLVGSYRSRVINIERLTSASGIMCDNWPIILGTKDSRNLLNNDLLLFVSILERLLIEFQYLETYSEVTITKTNITFDKLTLAAQIHKLRGGAGLIGAQELYQSAGRAEIALRSDENEVNPLLEEVAQHLTNLRLNSAEFLSQQQCITDERTEIDIQNIPSINLEHIKLLISRLKRQDLSALTMVEEYSKSLRFILGEKTFKKFKSMLQNLEFKYAVTLLDSTDWIFEEKH
jgi:CheY-like chemotaxis protein